MGWWDCGIMGGDTPLDYQNDIHDMLGIGHDRRPAAGQLSDSKLRDVIAHAESKGWMQEGPQDEPWLFWEVLAVIIMEAGAAMPDDIRASAVAAADAELASGCANWKRPGERRERLGEFRRAVEAYDGTPVFLSETGLLEKMAEMALQECGGKPDAVRMFAQIFRDGYLQANSAVRAVVEEMSVLAANPDLDDQEHDMALTTLATALGLPPPHRVCGATTQDGQ